MDQEYIAQTALDQITNMMTMAEMLRMMNEPSPEDNCEEERQ